MKAWFETEILLDNRLGKMDIKVLIVLSAHANNDGLCWPSRQRIADMTGIHIGNITNILKRIRDYGYIEIQASSGHSNRYKLQYYTPPNSTSSDKSVESNKDEGLLNPNKGELLESNKSQGLLESNKGGLLESNKGGLLEPNNQNYVYNYKENYNNKNTSKNDSSKSTKHDWKRMSFNKFKTLKSRPEFSEEFISVYKRYRKACSELDSEVGGKLQGFFRYLILIDLGFRHTDITASLRRYVESKRKSGMTMAHLSTVLNDPDLLRQHLEDEKDDTNQKSQKVEVEIPDFSARFDLSTPTTNSGQNSSGRTNHPRVDSDASPSRLEPTGVRNE